MKKAKAKNIIAWVLQVLLGLEYLLAGSGKLTNAEWWQRKFEEWGYPDHVYLVVGILEMLAGILIFFPKFSARAALAMMVVMAGAVATHLIYGEFDRFLAPLIIGLLTTGLFLLRRKHPTKVSLPS